MDEHTVERGRALLVVISIVLLVVGFVFENWWSTGSGIALICICAYTTWRANRSPS